MRSPRLYYGQPINRSHPLNRGLVSRWKVVPWYKSGPRLIDLAGRNHGTLTGGPAWSGASFGSLTFDGSNDFVSIPAISHTTTFSVAITCIYANAAQNAMLWSKLPVNSNWHVMLEGGNLRQRGASGGGSDLSTTAPAANVWHRIVATYAGTAFALYVDGVLCNSGTQTAAADGPGLLNIGRYDSGYYFNGSIAETSIWAGRALTASDVANDYQATRQQYDPTLSWLRRRSYAFTAGGGGGGNRRRRVICGAAA